MVRRFKSEKQKDLERILNLSKPRDNERYFAVNFMLLGKKYNEGKVNNIIQNCSWLRHYKILGIGYIELRLNSLFSPLKKISSDKSDKPDKLRNFFTKDENVEIGKLIKKNETKQR